MTGAGGTLVLEGAVTVETVPELVEQIAPHLKSGVNRVDFSRVANIDSAAVALALEWRRQAESASIPLALTNLPDVMRNLANLYGVADLLAAPDS